MVEIGFVWMLIAGCVILVINTADEESLHEVVRH